jgi:HEAT repeat protein
VDTPAPLEPQDAARLTEFARACKAAARAVVLYPGNHPAIAATLGRLVQLTSQANLAEPLRINVQPDALLVDGRAPARMDPAIGELATLLHDHLIGEMTVHAGGDVEAWQKFLLLLGRAPDAVRSEGGIGRLWTALAGSHVEVREIDYSEVLRERRGGEAAAWEQVIANCLQGDAFDLDDEAFAALVQIAGDPAKVAELMSALDVRAAESGHSIGHRTRALLMLMQGIVRAVAERQPESMDAVLRNLAGAVGQLTPDMLMSLLSQRANPPEDSTPDGVQGGGQPAGAQGLVNAVASRMSDSTIAQFVARNALAPGTSIDRVAQAFHTLVGGEEQRERLLTMAHDDAASSPLGNADGFEEAWENVAQKMLTSYSDKPFVSEEYARELSSARTKAVAVEHLHDDPPERLSAWRGTVATSELRRLDLTLVLDLLRLEQDTQRWSTLLRPVVSLLEDLLLVGDFDAASELLAALLRHREPDCSQERRQAAIIAVDVLVQGPLMRHIVTHLATIDDAQFEEVKAICLSIGDVLIRPLAETLSAEERVRPRERLTAILLGFGSIGRREVERLKSSPNAAVRRTAVYLLREFGGSDALPELAELLNDNEQQVQREAVRAILRIGSAKAYQVLEQALASGTVQSREAIMQSLTLVRDGGATPLLAYILDHVDHRGPLGAIYARAIEALGALKDPQGVPALKGALYRGEWWAPRRTAALRGAAAAALARIGSSEATAVLNEAVTAGSRGIRAAARAHLRGRTGPQ